MRKAILLIICVLGITVQTRSMQPTTAFSLYPLVTTNDDDVAALAIKIYNLMNDGRFESVREYFSSELKSNLTADQMKQVWMTAQFQAGKILSHGNPTVTNNQGFKQAIILIQYEKAKANFEIDVDGSNKLVGIWLRPAQ